jgi:hypothetical protein
VGDFGSGDPLGAADVDDAVAARQVGYAFASQQPLAADVAAAAVMDEGAGVLGDEHRVGWTWVSNLGITMLSTATHYLAVSIDHDGDVPVYIQLADILRARIQSGELAQVADLLSLLPPEVDENPAEVLRVLLHPVVQRFDVLAVEEPQHMLLQLA